MFDHLLHPFAQALVAAVSTLEDRGVARIRLSGELRSPVDPDPKVCDFHGCYPCGVDLCKAEMPPLRDFPGGRQAACRFAEANAVTQ